MSQKTKCAKNVLTCGLLITVDVMYSVFCHVVCVDIFCVLAHIYLLAYGEY